MCIYYLIHNLTSKGKNENDGPKNARTFLMGSVIYIILYMVVMNLSLKYKFQSGIMKSSLILLLCADIATMAYLYKAYYGRIILNELDDSCDKWKFDNKNHKYNKKTNSDIKMENEIDKIKQDYNTIKLNKLKKKIFEQKNEDKPILLKSDAEPLEDNHKHSPDDALGDNFIHDFAER